MQEKSRVFLLLCIALIWGQCDSQNSGSVEHCIDYYKTGDIFDLAVLQGEHYAVYFWPPNQRERDTCALVNFRKLLQHEINNALNGCNDTLPSNVTVLQATYINSASKKITLFYHGDNEVKYLYRSCGHTSRYIFIRINDNYLLGINCSAGGRGMLLSKTLPSNSDVQSIVKSIDFMAGREGRADCNLRPF
ncbi:uncharacterized protein ACR2FA_005675 [Aphomia sociella]